MAISGKWRVLKQNEKLLGILIFVVVILIVVITYSTSGDRIVIRTSSYPQDWYARTCFGNKLVNPNKDADLTNIITVLKPWSESKQPYCRSLFKRFSHIYHIHQSSGSLKIPDPLLDKFRKSGFSEKLIGALAVQNITKVTNILTHESNVFNPVRNMRPVVVPEIPDRQYVEQLSEETSKSCDFCNYKSFTSIDSIGRIESRYAYTASNTFKFDGWHSLVLLKRHHPLDWTREHFLDLFNTALQWVSKVHEAAPKYRYGNILWDLLPKSGASQVHPHIHVTVSDDRYHEQLQMWVDVAGQYAETFPGNSYFADQLEIHHAMGLTLKHGSASAYASLTPRKDNEVVILGQSADVDFFHLLFIVIKGLQQELDQLCFSMGLALQPLGAGEWGSSDIPVFARIATRGVASDRRSDISAIELFGMSNVNQSPYVTMEALLKMQAKTATKESQNNT